MKNGIKTLAMWLIIGVIFIVVLSSIVENSDAKLKYSELITNINNGNVEDIEIQADGTTAMVTLKDDKIKKEVNIPDVGNFISYTEEYLKEALECYSRKYGENLVTIDNYAIRFVPSLQVMEFWN